MARLRPAIRQTADWITGTIVAVRYAAPRPVRWLLEHPQRLLTVAWLVGVLVVGTAQTASADIIVGPDLAQGAPKTLYETYDFADYKLTVKPDEENSDWFGIEDTVLQVVGFINNMILWACLGMLNGGLSLLEWFLNLTLYRDSAPEIDTATRMLADEVFWPLIAATVAVGAFITYARWRADGHGFLSDFGWVVAAGTLAVGFAAGPSQLMDTVDSVRQDLATGVMRGSANYTDTAGNPTGFPTPEISGDAQKASTRRLVDGVWNTFGATPWCFAEFRSLDVCKVAGHHALAGDEQWQQWMDTLDNGGAPPEFGDHTHWIRGQDITRTGYLLVLALITIPMGLILLRLVVSGLVAVAGFLLMLVIGLLFLVLWPIPGWFRQLGTRYWVYTIGLEFQALFITLVISGATVVSVIISTHTGKYGFLVVALLNLGLFAAAMKARTWLELLTTMGGAGALGYAFVLLMRSAARTAGRAGSAVTHGTSGLARQGIGGGPTNRARDTGLPGFKNAGNWLHSRFPAERNADLDDDGYNPHTDVETLTTASGDTKATYGYTAYGSNDTEAFSGIDKPDTQNPGKEPFNFYRYTGKRFDPASGGYDMGFRDYQPGINRFTVRDTYNGALADLNLATSAWTGNRYSLAGGNPITGVEIDGHKYCVDSECRYTCPSGCTNEQAAAVDDQMAADKVIAIAPTGGGTTGTKPSKDYTSRHDRAVDVAVFVIQAQVQAVGGDPTRVVAGYRIKGGSKKRNGKYGYADITYDDGQTIWVWEVKSAGQASKAESEAQWYADQITRTVVNRNGKKGWSIGGPYPGMKNDRVVGVGPGAIVYYGDTLPKRSPTPVPVPAPSRVPIHVPAPAPSPKPAPTPAPDPGGIWDWLPPPEVLLGGGLVVAGGLACATAVGCSLGGSAIVGGAAVIAGG